MRGRLVKLAFEFLVLTGGHGPARYVGAVWNRDRSGTRVYVDNSCYTDEGKAGAPGAAMPPRHGNS